MRLSTRVALALGLTFALLLGGVTVRPDRASATTTQDEQTFIGLVNDFRASKGVGPLVVHGELTTAARSWTSHMAATDQLSHTPNMAADITAPWTVLGENVGVHGIHDVGQLFQAFVNSPPHYQNLVDPRFGYIGVGVVTTSSGQLWTTHRFMAMASAPAPAATTTTTTAAAVPWTTMAPSTSTTAAPAPSSAAPTTAPEPPTTQTPTTAGPSGSTPPGSATTIGSSDAIPPVSTTVAGAVGDPDPATAVPTAEASEDQAAHTEPDVETVEQVLMELVKAGI